MPVKTTIAFLRNSLESAKIESHRSRVEIFFDRLKKSASEPTLSLMMEHLLAAMDADATLLHPAIVTRMIGVASSPAAPRVLRWLREQSRLCVMLAVERDREIVDQALAGLTLPDEAGQGIAATRQAYQIELRAICETPLAHGSDEKAGNAKLFRRISVLATNGAVLELPYYSGNAVKGQMRDLLADHLLAALGLSADKSAPVLTLWFFYALYSGGALEEKSNAMRALKKQLGDHGAIRTDGIRIFRDMLPALSMLGCALGNRILPGHIRVGDLRPVCREWGTGPKPASELMAWEFLTRREDFEDHVENHSMIANTEVLRAGVELEGGIDMDSAMPEIERAALGKGLELLAARSALGGERRRGFGRVQMMITGATSGAAYDAWLVENKEKILEYLKTIGALP